MAIVITIVTKLIVLSTSVGFSKLGVTPGGGGADPCFADIMESIDQRIRDFWPMNRATVVDDGWNILWGPKN